MACNRQNEEKLSNDTESLQNTAECGFYSSNTKQHLQELVVERNYVVYITHIRPLLMVPYKAHLVPPDIYMAL